MTFLFGVFIGIMIGIGLEKLRQRQLLRQVRRIKRMDGEKELPPVRVR